jgi:hypothetical protein
MGEGNFTGDIKNTIANKQSKHIFMGLERYVIKKFDREFFRLTFSIGLTR